MRAMWLVLALSGLGHFGVHANTCSGQYPSYWQDPAFAPMWQGQEKSNTPTNHALPVFRLSDDYPDEAQDETQSQPWRNPVFDPLFDEDIPQPRKRVLAEAYLKAVFEYTLAGNIEAQAADFSLCDNPVRGWYHMPFQTYEVMSGREYIHGLTREAPVSYSVMGAEHQATMWAVGIYNPTAAYTLGQVWHQGKAKIPRESVVFEEGAVVAKLLFNTLSENELPVLANMPAWQANISDPHFCECVPQQGSRCSLVEQSRQCPRLGPAQVRLLQFDLAIREPRASETGWVFATLVADGERKQGVSSPWRRLTWLGLMWGNDTPPLGQLATFFPASPRIQGFRQAVINWDMVDELNRFGGDDPSRWPGHLGCNNRLNGPADDANSSCMSCHATASVPDALLRTPAMVAQFKPWLTAQCVVPTGWRKGVDRLGQAARAKWGVSFEQSDAWYFANTQAGDSFISGVIERPFYPNVRQGEWISLDYSLQLSISLKQWMLWQRHKHLSPDRRFVSE